MLRDAKPVYEIPFGALPAETAFVECTGDGMVLYCFKQAEDGNSVHVPLAPHAIASLRVLFE